MSVLIILPIVGLFSQTSNKNSANCTDDGLFSFLITCVFNDRWSFIAEFDRSWCFLNYDVCRGSPQNITIFLLKKLSLLVMPFGILLTANMLYVRVIKASSHIIIMRNLMLMFTWQRSILKKKLFPALGNTAFNRSISSHLSLVKEKDWQNCTCVNSFANDHPSRV